MESINLNGFNNLETINVNKNNSNLGLEFLMNQSVKDKKQTKISNIDFNDINNLENELNEMSGINSNIEEFVMDDKDNMSVEYSSLPKNNSTWDGYSSKIEEIPRENVSKLSERQKRVKKMMMIQKLENWSKKGLIELVGNTHYTIDSSFEDVEDEYENALDNKRKKDSIKLQGNLLIGLIGFIEGANKWVNPFDVDLDGFQEKVSDELSDYDDIFAELFEKYKGGKLAPEVQLILKLGLTGATIGFTNKYFNGGNTDFNNLLKTNPNIINAIQTELINSTLNKNLPPNNNNSISTHLGGGPPPPIETKISKEKEQISFANRPDLSVAKDSIFREQGVNLDNNYQYINNNNNNNNLQSQRPEMKGPQSIQVNNILSELKENVQFPIYPPKQNNPIMTPNFNMTQSSNKFQNSNVLQPTHTQFPQQTEYTDNSFYNQTSQVNEEYKNLKIENFDELSLHSFNVSKEDNSDNISNLSNDEFIIQSKPSSKRGRKSKQHSEKNKISMDI